MSLRARLLLVLAGLAVVGVLAADVVTYTELRSFLIDRVDRTTTASARSLAGSLVREGVVAPDAIRQLGESTPGVYVGLVDLEGAVLWSPIGVRPGETPPPQPRLPEDPRATSPGGGSVVTIGAEEGSTEYRARFEPLPDGETLVVAAPLDEVKSTLDRLLLIEVLVSLGVVGAIVGIGLWLVRLGLRPLRRIEQTAAAIAGGDLSQRIATADTRTEVGRLGLALNSMLGQIETGFAERSASAERLRRFVSDASHELRTPLSSIQAYAELFDRGARDRPEDLARTMAGIEREARRMGVLVDDLLLLARLDQGRPLDRKLLDLSEVAGEAVEVARTLDPDRRLELIAPEPVEVVGDPERLRQAIDNLLANVRAHTPPGTPASVRVLRDADGAVVEVTDEGPGLTDDQAARAFERFYRGDPSRSRDAGSTGLGLAIVAAVAEVHGGAATISSGAESGVTVRIALPFAATTAEGEGESPGPVELDETASRS
jgi:two-component system OmpR family sensor kinase